MPEQNTNRQKKRKVKKSGCAIVFFMFAVFIIVLASISIMLLKVIFDAGTAKKPVENMTGISLVLEDEAIDGVRPVLVNDSVMLNVDFIRDCIDSTIFWDEGTGKLTVTTADKVIRMSTDELTYLVNNEPFDIDVPVYTENENVYMPSSLAETLYNISVTYNSVSDMVIVDRRENDISTAVIIKRAVVYSEADKKSDKVLKLQKNDNIKLYSQTGDFTKIRTDEGKIGYIYTKYIGQTKQVKGSQKEIPEEKIAWSAPDGKITMVWDQIFNVEQNSRESKRIAMDGLDVISPTWFALENGQGDISNIADEEYVKWAHNNGYQVWALFSNSFDADITHQALGNTDTREKIIKQILAYVSIYNLDGINIDFESVSSDTGEYYVQFIREITPYLKAQGVTVSVDMYVPRAWTSHYGMEEVGSIVDYVVIMAYDEHWGTSPESGSVASLGWVYSGMEAAMEMVDNSRIIMGIPFYTRLWQETPTDDGIEVSSSAYGMKGGLENLSENNAELIWLKDIGQHYGEYEKDGSTYKMWVEDNDSLKVRLDTALKLDVAGISSWKRGLESDEAWSIIESKMKN